MTKPTTIPEAIGTYAAHPLPHPEQSHIIRSTFTDPVPQEPRRRICWPCVGVWSVVAVWCGLALMWLWVVIAGRY